MGTYNEETEEEYMPLEVYPNPTKGELNIPLSENNKSVIKHTAPFEYSLMKRTLIIMLLLMRRKLECGASSVS